MINNINYSLETDNGSMDGFIIIKQTDDKKYNWDYIGNLKRSI